MTRQLPHADITLERAVLPDDQQGYVLVQDDSCHWYVIPSHLQALWDRFCEDEDACEAPDWARRVNGPPSLVVFRSWRIA